MVVGNTWVNSLGEIKRLAESGYALQTLYDLMSEDDLSKGNVSKLENLVSKLEMHENEVRRLRQTLNLRLRQIVLESYLEELKKRSERIA